jgi:pyruvate dehydrogenase E1 component alpha subunit
MPDATDLLPDDLSGAEWVALYRQMVLIRRFEEKAGQLYGMGLIGGHCHLYVGQEAIAVGLGSLRRAGDSIVTGYRDHAHALASGSDPIAIMAELMGRETGLAGGRGGSMHLSDPKKGFYGGHALLGVQVPIGAGLAFAARYRGDGVAHVCFGDGAADRGAVAETYALAARLALPAVFVIEMNRDAAPEGRKSTDPAPPGLAERAAGWNIPFETVDGMDLVAVRAAGARAATRARKGKGPTVLEMRTDRYRGHAPGHRRDDPTSERARKARDCIARLRARLIEAGHADDAALRTLEAEAKTEVAAAADAARDAAPARPDREAVAHA